MLLKKSLIKILLYKLDTLLQYYPSLDSPENINLLDQMHFLIPHSQQSSSSNKKQINYDIYVSEYIFSSKVKKLNGFMYVFRPEIQITTIKRHLQNIIEIFKIYRNSFTSFKFFYILIPQISTISHFQVLQKLSSCSNEFQRIYTLSSHLLLFVKFIDIQNHPWPVVLKDAHWLAHFEGDIRAKNNQFFRLLETIESFPYNAVRILSEPPMNHLISSPVFVSNLTLNSRNIVEESRYFCFGCRTILDNIQNRCKVCGIILCSACSTILELQPASQKMCPGNIYTAINFHDFER